MELWFTEEWSEHIRFSLKVKRHLYHNKTPFQTVDIIETHEFGRIMLLDGMVMFSDRDEAHYHEMLVHVPMFAHPAPRNVLVIGGGDGGTVRELIRHSSVKHIDLVEIDREVVEKSREYFPQIASQFDNPRVHIHYEDGLKFVKSPHLKYDIALIDSTDPVGPAVGLYEKPFYNDVCDCLTDDGMICAQAESSMLNPERVKAMGEKLREFFPLVMVYLSFIPTYPVGQWAFILGSKKHHPLKDYREEAVNSFEEDFTYYNPEIHRAAFALPTKFKTFYLKLFIN